MFELAVFTGLIVVGVVFGAWQSRRNAKHDLPNPFRQEPRK